MRKLLSLTIPTNGVSKWVFPVLDSIYLQNEDQNDFEVIVTNNGNNAEFHQSMIEYSKKYKNLIYKKTTAVLFANQIEAFKLASGEFIKFVNHRSILKQNTLRYLLNYVKDNLNEKPITYFMNQATYPHKKDTFYSDFDSFIYELSYYSTWSGGVSCWKSDLQEALNTDLVDLNFSLFPHTCFIYICKTNRKYQVIYTHLFSEVPALSVEKGNYDLFYAFGVEFLNVLYGMKNRNMIDHITVKNIRTKNLKFIANLYLDYVIMKKDCSYDLSTAKNSLNSYYSYHRVQFESLYILSLRILKKIKRGG